MFDSYAETFGDVAVVHLIGDFTRSTIIDADDSLYGYLSSSAAVIAFDCREMDRVDSYGINHLFKFAKAALEKDLVIILYDVNYQVMTLVELTKLNRLFRVMKREDFRREFISTYQPSDG